MRNQSVTPTGRIAALSALADHRSRRVVAVVESSDAPVRVADLVGRLVARGDDEQPAEGDRGSERSARLRLVHAVLPELEETGLVRWDRPAGLVAAAQHPVLDEPGIDGLLAADEEWDEALSAVAHERRPVVLAVLAAHEEPMGRRELAAAVHAREERRPGTDPGTVTGVDASLHHVHLPVLSDAGLVEPAGADRVEVADHPLVDALVGGARVASSGEAADRTDGSIDDRRVGDGPGDIGRAFGPIS